MTKDNSESFKYDGKYLRQGDLIFNLATAALRLNEYQKKIDELEEQLRGERQATKTFSEHLNNERVRHGSTEKKLQAAEEKLTECASNYWKEVEKRKASEEENKILREAVESIANLEQVSKDLDASVWYAKTAIKARQALEKVRKE